MEVEVHIIEKYFQVIKGCFTMSNIRLKGGKEIDLLAINPKTNRRYHIESRVSTSHKLKIKETFTKTGKRHRNGVDFFHNEKFEHPTVKEGITKFFGNNDYQKILVVYNYEDGAKEEARKFGIEVIRINEILSELMNLKFEGARDEILRTVDLFHE